MDYLVNSSEMKSCDSFIIDKIGVPSMVLMERAALSAVDQLYKGSFDLESVLIVCGSGNNGADGFAVARLLYLKGIDVDVLFVGNEENSSPENKKQLEIIKNYGVSIYKKADFDEYTTIIDAIFGVGLSRQVKGRYVEVIEKMNSSDRDILSLDIPSGISADTGKVMGLAVKAKETVTFAYNKIGLVLYPGAEYAGKVSVKDIGITDIGFENNYPSVYSYSKEDLDKLPKRYDYSNKGTYGKVLVIGGNVNMSGAAYFSAKAAYKTGAGLVKIYTPEENRTILQTMLPEAILNTYLRDNIDMEALKRAISWASVVVFGPGMGIEENTKIFLETLLENTHIPMVIDADGINIIAKYSGLIENHNSNIILTPHLGEMSRLINKDISHIQENLIEEAREYTKKSNVICVLKDTRTVVADGHGNTYINRSGNNGMATGGSGDVLTGIIAGLLAQGVDNLEAASLGTYLHGLAGDKAAEKLGVYSMTANDIIDGIRHVLRL